jgi:uncharacterized protein (DUF169 family)
MASLKEVDEALSLFIRPQTFPVAIRMCQPGEVLPAKVRMPLRNLGSTIAICQGISMARRYGWKIAIGKDDESCPHGLVALGFVTGKSYDDGTSGEVAGMGPKEQLAKKAGRMSRLEYGKYNYVLIAPLQGADFEPHVIVIYGNPAQIVRLVQGSVAIEGNPVITPSLGGLACTSLISRTMLTNECQVVLAGAGDRYFALTQDHEMAFSIPMSKADLVIQGVRKGHESGMARFPTPSSLKLKEVLPPGYYRWAELLRHEDEGG